MGVPVLQPAPGARAARTFGTLAIVAPFAGGAWLLTTYQFWFSFWWFVLVVPLLAGLGTWKHFSAKGVWKREPSSYSKPTGLSFRFCLWGLAFDALFLGIFIPAIWVDVVAGRDRYTVNEAVKAPVTALVDAYPGLARSKTTHQEVLKGLDSVLDQTNAQGPNVWDRAYTLVNPHIEEVLQQTPEAVEAVARAEAKQLGQGVFVLAFPSNGHPGYLAAAARLKTSRDATGGADSKINSEVVELPGVD